MTEAGTVNQRYYVSTYGRFNTPDPMAASASAGNPGSWNRYAYVGGDPINHRDRTGMNEADTEDDICGSDGEGCVFRGGIAEEGGGGGGGAMELDPCMVMFLTNPTANCEGYGGGVIAQEGGDLNAQGAGGPGFIHVANLSKTGLQQERIVGDLDWIQGNIDPKCSGWLSGIGGIIPGLEGDPLNPGSVAIAHGTFDTAYNAFSGNDPSRTDVPAGYAAIVVNDDGAFFSKAVTAAGYAGGSSQAQILILLHEIAHLLSTNNLGAAGFKSDFGQPANGQSNDNLLKQNCQTTLNAAKNIP